RGVTGQHVGGQEADRLRVRLQEAAGEHLSRQLVEAIRLDGLERSHGDARDARQLDDAHAAPFSLLLEVTAEGLVHQLRARLLAWGNIVHIAVYWGIRASASTHALPARVSAEMSRHFWKSARASASFPSFMRTCARSSQASCRFLHSGMSTSSALVRECSAAARSPFLS